ncbi:MAG TPA: serine hydrolase, partial [Bryobacteraceae bacterium]|nr:serine hydrolase [Bryobacteraceae bacterium]
MVFAKGYGVRRLDSGEPVTPKTLFGVASNTKAFTAAALAILVDEKKLAWDDRVIDRLPSFQMGDPYVSREMRIRDLLIHNSGLALGAGDLMYFPESTFTSDEVYSRLRYVPLSTSFRSRYAYDNILYLVAGKVIETMSGKPWDVFIRERILDPLGMTQTALSVKTLASRTDVALPHAPGDDGKLRQLGHSNMDNNAPAAAIQSSVEEMSRWVMLQLNRGELDGKRIFSERQSREMWSMQTIIPVVTPRKPLAALQANFAGYGLGWNLADYRGEKIVSHTGGLFGMVSRVTMVPSKKLGVIVLTNQENGAAFNAITWTVVDQYLGAPATDWVAAHKESLELGRAEALKKTGDEAAKRNAASKPALPLSAYAGRYRDAWYGDVVVDESNGQLTMRFTHSPSLNGVMEHFQYDTFIARWGDRTMNADAYVTFLLSAEGAIDHVRMKAVSPLTDFSFDFHHLDLKPVAKDTPAYD